MPRKPPRKLPQAHDIDQRTIGKLSAIITAQQADIDRLELANKGLVALLATALCPFCVDGFCDGVDMQTGEVSKEPCSYCCQSNPT